MTWVADAYVVKSADLTELKSTIRKVLVRRGADLDLSMPATDRFHC